MKKNLTLLFYLLIFSISINTAFAQSDPVLVSDYNPGTESGFNPYYDAIIVNGSIIMLVNNPSVGEELGIIIDGNINILKDINPDGDSSPSSFVYFNEKIFFTAFDPVNGNTVWQTDGTESGTTMFFDPNETDETTWRKPLGMIISDSNHLYFSYDRDLFRTDGSSTNIVQAGGAILTANGNTVSPAYCTYEDGIAFMAYDSPSDILSIYKATDTTELLAELTIPEWADYYGISEVAAGLLFSINGNDITDSGLYVYNKSNTSLEPFSIDVDNPAIARAVPLGTDKQFAYFSPGGYYTMTGIPGETEQVLDAGISTFALSPLKYTYYEDQLIFQTEDVFSEGHPIAITDGTAAGTEILFTTENNISNIISHGPYIFVASGIANSNSSDITLYDMVSGIKTIVSAFEGAFTKSIQLYGLVGNQLYFGGRLDNDLGYELYSVDVGDFVVGQEEVNDINATVLLTDHFGEISVPNLDEQVMVEIYDIDGKKLTSFSTNTNTKFDINYPSTFNIVVFRIGDVVVSRKYVKH